MGEHSAIFEDEGAEDSATDANKNGIQPKFEELSANFEGSGPIVAATA